MADLIIMTVFPALVLAAGIGDFLTMKIPNWLNGLIGISFFPIALLAGMPVEQIGWHVLAGLLVLIVAFICFGFGFFGGGDAKMLAVVAMWLGFSQLGIFLIVMSIIGGLLAITMKLWWIFKLETERTGVERIKSFFKSSIDLPYGIAIAAGALFAFQHSWWVVSTSSQVVG